MRILFRLRQFGVEGEVGDSLLRVDSCCCIGKAGGGAESGLEVEKPLDNEVEHVEYAKVVHLVGPAVFNASLRNSSSSSLVGRGAGR